MVGLLSSRWYLAFESASAASLYYQCERKPDFLKHRFIYPNEAEATDMLIEFLRPMLSAGKAVRLTVNNTGAHGANQAQELEVRGPITTVIPTVRNRLDEQLQTRLLVAELDDYEGRVRQHARAFSRLLLPDYAPANDAETKRRWNATLESLTDVRRVVFPLERDEFALDNDGISHGARLWANVLGLMSSHAWLEQRNREILRLPSGERAVVATPDDYEAAYHVFAATSCRTVVNISATHRKLLGALYELRQEASDARGFSQRRIAEKAQVTQGAVSKNKTFLVTSLKLVRETEHGLALVSDADPSWWASDDLMHGFPTPEMVRKWWSEGESPSGPGGGQKSDARKPGNRWNTGNHRHQHIGQDLPVADAYAENGRRDGYTAVEMAGNHPENGHSGMIPEHGIADSSLPMRKTGDKDRLIPAIPSIPASSSNGHDSAKLP